MDKIGIIITTFLRDDLLFKCIDSFIKYAPDNCELIICDQCNTYEEKKKYLNKDKRINYIPLSFDSGISYSRNEGVKFAKLNGFKYCIISADSIIFNESFLNINNVLHLMDKYDIIGLNLNNRKVGWEGYLSLINGKCFEINFIDKKYVNCNYISKGIPIWNCNIIRNFFISKTDILFKNKWDNELKAAEHEDMFYRLSQNNAKIAWTDYISGDYIGNRSGDYNKYRQKNWQDGQIKLRKKYNISNWVVYKNLDRAKENG